MRYRELGIQTQREFPNNARTPGFGWLARAGYITREGEILPLGERVPKVIPPSLAALSNGQDFYFPLSTGAAELARCPACGYVARRELAVFKKTPFSAEAPLPIEKVSTPACPTIEALAAFLNLPKEKTAKALMFTRAVDSRFVFVVVRGDMTLSEAKLKTLIGDFRLATAEEIANAGAAAGYASPLGLQGALVVVDDLIPHSPNLAAGANEAGYHLLNTNYGRDYSAEIAADLALANAGDSCAQCGGALEILSALPLTANGEILFENLLLALAEAHHDEKGLTLPQSVAPFDVYLMHVPGKELDVRAQAEAIYQTLLKENIRVLFDDRDERAGVKFNDADLIGCPVRVTAGERGLKEGKVEVKARSAPGAELIPLDGLAEYLQKSL